VRGKISRNVLRVSFCDTLLCSDEALLFLSFEGDVKVFDFGLCKNLNPKLKAKGGIFKLTGRTGSFPYMAPGECLQMFLKLCRIEFNFTLSPPLFHRGCSMSSL